MAILSVIPARGGSKAIPRKNIASVNGRALISYTIEASLSSSSIDQTIVSTDDLEIAAISKKWGADVPFMRATELAGDEAPMLAVIEHALMWYESSVGPLEAVILLQPTSPLRTTNHIEEAIDLFQASDASSVVSVTEVPHQFNPVSVMALENGFLVPLLAGINATRRQDKPCVFARNGPSILICHPSTIKSGELYGDRCIPYVMSSNDSLDIDEPSDIGDAELALSTRALKSK